MDGDSDDAGPGYRWASLHERFTAKEARQFRRWITSTRRLLTGTVLPHLARDPVALSTHGLLAQLEGLATQILEQLHDEDPRDAAVRPRVQELLDLIEDGLAQARRDLNEDDEG